jgi:phage terminase large subunit GpA-like protein
MATLEQLFIERITNGLRRKSITDPAKWACAHRILSVPYPGPWTFYYHPWLQELHLSKNEYNVGQKAAQMGFTETMLNIVFYKIDVEQVDCLYVLPAKTPDAGDFSAARFDPALELSPHLSKLFSDVKNVGHKRAGTTNLYIRGSKSRAGLKSLPAGVIILDEVDEFNQENIGLAFERSSGQKIRLVWLISTPRFEGTGINKYYEQSTKENYFFKCPYCNRFINLTFPESLEITADSLDDPSLNNSYLKCSLCNHKLTHETKPQWLANKYNSSNNNESKNSGTGTWIPETVNGDMKGFHVSQLYSTTVTPVNLARSYLKSLQDPSDEQIFYNDKLGITHTVEGARLTNHQIESTKGIILMGRPNLVTII